MDIAERPHPGQTDKLSKSILAVSLTVHCGPSVQMIRLYNDLPATELTTGRIKIELGDFYVEEDPKSCSS